MILKQNPYGIFNQSPVGNSMENPVGILKQIPVRIAKHYLFRSLKQNPVEILKHNPVGSDIEHYGDYKQNPLRNSNRILSEHESFDFKESSDDIPNKILSGC